MCLVMIIYAIMIIDDYPPLHKASHFPVLSWISPATISHQALHSGNLRFRGLYPLVVSYLRKYSILSVVGYCEDEREYLLSWELRNTYLNSCSPFICAMTDDWLQSLNSMLHSLSIAIASIAVLRVTTNSIFSYCLEAYDFLHIEWGPEDWSHICGRLMMLKGATRRSM